MKHKHIELPTNIIEIDDSGIGCLYGGLSIIFNNFKEPKFLYITPSYFQYNTYDIKEIYKLIYKLILDCLKEYDKKKITLNICRGSIFNYACKRLKKLKYKINRVKIEGETQELIEDEFKDELSKILIDTSDYTQLLERVKIERDFEKTKSFWTPVREIMLD